MKCQRGCDKEFNATSTRTKHYKREHPTFVKTYACNCCAPPKNFDKARQRASHQYFKKNANKCKCPGCGRTFATKQKYEAHTSSLGCRMNIIIASYKKDMKKKAVKENSRTKCSGSEGSEESNSEESKESEDDSNSLSSDNQDSDSESEEEEKMPTFPAQYSGDHPVIPEEFAATQCGMCQQSGLNPRSGNNWRCGTCRVTICSDCHNTGMAMNHMDWCQGRINAWRRETRTKRV